MTRPVRLPSPWSLPDYLDRLSRPDVSVDEGSLSGDAGETIVSGVVSGEVPVYVEPAELAAPTNVTVETGSDGQGSWVDVLWDDVEGASGYEVELVDEERESALPVTRHPLVPPERFINLPGHEHSVRVRATQPAGPGLWSDEVTFTPPTISAPSDGAAPASSPTPAPTPGPGYIVWRWTAVANDDFTVYEVHSSTTTGFIPDATTKVGETPATQFVQTRNPNGSLLAYGTTYHVVLIAKDDDGEAAPGTEASSSPEQLGPDDAAFGTVVAGQGLFDGIEANLIDSGEIVAADIEVSTGGRIWSGTRDGSDVLTSGWEATPAGINVVGGTITGSTITGGTVRTAVTGERVEVDNTVGSQVRFVDSSDVVQARLGLTGGNVLLLRAGSRVQVADLSGTLATLRAKTLDVRANLGTAFAELYDTSGNQRGELLLTSPSANLFLRAAGGSADNVGIKLLSVSSGSAVAQIRNALDTAYRDIEASAFTVSSDPGDKQDMVELGDVREQVRAVKVWSYRLRDQPGRIRVGLNAADPALHPALVISDGNGRRMIDMYGALGVIWRFAQQVMTFAENGRQQAAEALGGHEARIAALESRVPPQAGDRMPPR